MLFDYQTEIGADLDHAVKVIKVGNVKTDPVAFVVL